MSYYDRAQSDSYRPGKKRQPQAAAWASKLLSKAQIQKLAIAARNAWDVQSQAGCVEGCFDDWRHAETAVACGVASLREATNNHFRAILAHFLRLAGNTAEADKIWKRTGRVAGSAEVHDTHENREVARAVLRDLVARSDGHLNEAYVMAIVRGKFSGCGGDLYQLTAKNLQDLIFTLKARLTALRRRGV